MTWCSSNNANNQITLHHNVINLLRIQNMNMQLTEDEYDDMLSSYFAMTESELISLTDLVNGMADDASDIDYSIIDTVSDSDFE